MGGGGRVERMKEAPGNYEDWGSWHHEMLQPDARCRVSLTVAPRTILGLGRLSRDRDLELERQ